MRNEEREMIARLGTLMYRLSLKQGPQWVSGLMGVFHDVTTALVMDNVPGAELSLMDAERRLGLLVEKPGLTPPEGDGN